MQEVERIGISEKKLRRLRFIATFFQIPIGLLGILMYTAGIFNGSRESFKMAGVGVFFFYLPLLLRTEYSLKERFIEISDDGLRQGKKFIPWNELVQVMWVQEKMIKQTEVAKKVGYFFLDGKGNQYIKILLHRKISPQILIEKIINKAGLEEIKDLPDSPKYAGFQSDEATKWRGLWINDSLYRQRLEYERQPKPFPENLLISNWSITAKRVFGGLIGLIDLVFIIYGYSIIWQGKVKGYIPVFIKIATPVGIINFLFFWVILSSLKRYSVWHAFVMVLGIFLFFTMSVIS